MVVDRGVVLYQQMVGSAVATLGWDSDEPPHEPDYVEPIPGTSLRVAGWVQSPGYPDPWLIGEAAATYAILLVLVGLSQWLGFSALRRAMLFDLTALVEVVDDAVNRRPMRTIETRVAESRSAHQKIFNLLSPRQPSDVPSRGAAEPLKPERPVPAAEPADDGIGSTTRLSESSFEVEEIDLLGAFDPYADPESLLLQMSEDLGRIPLEAYRS